MSVVTILRLTFVGVLGLGLAGCLTTETDGSTRTSRSTQPIFGSSHSAASPAGYRVSADDAENTSPACVNDLAVFQASLQMPEAVQMDLNKSVSSYIREAGDAQAARARVDQRLAALNVALETEVENRDPFNLRNRARSDDAISTIEDSILLNEALAEAISCYQD